MKNTKQKLKKLTAAFTLAVALPATPAMLSAASPAQPLNPLGIWKTNEHKMIAEIKSCNDGTDQLCGTIYRTTRESAEEALEKERARSSSHYVDARMPPPPSSSEQAKEKPNDYCEIYKTVHASRTGENTWESESITVAGLISARAEITQIDNTHTKGEAVVKLFGLPIASFDVGGTKISRESPEFKPCKNLKP